ncbi:hypothetical protein V2A60_008604 [Cordyceps javanica]
MDVTNVNLTGRNVMKALGCRVLLEQGTLVWLKDLAGRTTSEVTGLESSLGAR